MQVSITSPYFVLGRQHPSTYTHVRLGLLPPSGLVWLVIWPGTLRLHARCWGNSLESHWQRGRGAAGPGPTAR